MVGIIPNAGRAVVEIDKLLTYSFNIAHDRGKHKARKFASALGMTTDDAEALRHILLRVITEIPAILGELDKYGQRYRLDFPLQWKGRSAIVRSLWIVRANEDFPRLTSCFVK